MALVVANVGELLLLEWSLKSTSTPENLILKLYKNDVTPSQSSVAGDFTVADFTGYSNKTLSRGSWASPTTVSNKASTSYAAQTFTNSGTAQTIYGYYVVGATSGTLIWAERFSAARTLNNGDSVTVTPSLTANSEN